MSLYRKHILPNLMHCACSLQSVTRQREVVIPLARGTVLEVGLGSGLNIPFYDAEKVSKVWGLDPSTEMLGMAEKRAMSAGFDVEFISSFCEGLALETNSVDTVVVTYTLCTIVDVDQAIQEMARVLRPGGELVFCEHGAAPEASVRRLQNFINPAWKCISGGCNLNRDIPGVVERGGFRINEMQKKYISGWRPASYNYWGTATLK